MNKQIEELDQKQESQRKEVREKEEEAKYTPGGKRIHAKHPEWSAEDCNAIAKGHIGVGMTKEQVAAAWGRPYHINKTTNTYGTSEQWVMHELGNSYVYFDDGICTSIQN